MNTRPFLHTDHESSQSFFSDQNKWNEKASRLYGRLTRMMRYAALACVLAANGCVAAEDSLAVEEPTDSDSAEIVGGTNASILSFPWQVSLQTRAGQDFCGGSILNSRYILTSQHCIKDDGAARGSISPPVTLRVGAGSSRLSTMPSTGQIHLVEDIIPFPGFIESERGKDIALVRLSSAITFNSTVGVIGPATAADEAAGLTNPGVVGTLTGWGDLSTGGSAPDTLQKVDLFIVDNLVAQVQYPNMITPDQLAAGGELFGGKGDCLGDSGGALVVPKGTTKIIAGIASYSRSGVCAEPLVPDMFARASSFEPFITRIKNMAPITLLSQANQSGATDSFRHFAVSVPAGTTALNAHLSGGTGDADLYVRFGSQPTTSTFDCAPFTDGNNESCSIGNPPAGTWFISIHGFSSYSGAALRVTRY